ncbi:MAG: T9SS type A sorting domain-containing protein, partial [Bacteroidetes bacterium]|nr:T9SS type A sorting domain-containing protein [Bacteroidota bacterium]
LKLYYADGSYKYSNIISLHPTIVTMLSLAVGPNPFRDEVRLVSSSPKQQGAVVSFYDMQGRKLREEKITLPLGYYTQAISGLGGLAAGIYTMVVKWDGGSIERKLVK